MRLSWRYGSDGSLNNEGWYVDDIAVTHVQIAGSCSVATLFVNGFESDRTRRLVRRIAVTAAPPEVLRPTT